MKLYAGVISDALQFDLGVNIEEHVACSPYLYHAGMDNIVICGPAFTCKGAAYTPETDQDRFRIEMLQFITPGCIQVIDPGTVDYEVAHYGDISALLAQKQGAIGCLVDGFTRDVELLPENFLVATSKGAHPCDAYGRWQITEHSVPVKYGNLHIHPGDFIHISADGIVVIPWQYAWEVNKCAQERANRESQIRRRIYSETNPLKIYDEEPRW